jgi:hypothetical protein
VSLQRRGKQPAQKKGGCREKPCQKCNFIFRPATSGHRYCSPCGISTKRTVSYHANTRYREKHRDKVRAAKSEWDLRRYGLESSDYHRMLHEQGGLCAICREVGAAGRGILRKLAVDHCHATGRVRGLLCHRCNGALGMMLDNVDVMKRAVVYLERWL